MTAIPVLIALFFVAVLPGLTFCLIARQSREQGSLGLGPLHIKCPQCGTAQPFIRKPSSVPQMLFGGYSCSGCGLEIEKYGRAV